MQTANDSTARMQRVERGLVPLGACPDDRALGMPLAERMAFYGVPGVSIAVINDTQLEWAQGYGVREVGEPSLVTPESLFQAGSVSKPIAAVTTLRLVRTGQLDLDADVNDSLRSWKIPANGSWQPRVTLRHLLSHSSGVTVHGFPGYRRDGAIPSLTQVLRGEHPANTPPVPTRAPVAAATLDHYAGVYALLPGSTLTVTRAGNTLSIEPNGQPPLVFVPESETTFFSEVVDTKLTFVTTDAGAVTGVRFRQNGREIVGNRS